MWGSTACMLVCLSVCVADNILVVFPVPERAHSALGDALVRTLLENHYEVTYISVYPKKSSHPNITYVDISSVRETYNGAAIRSANDILRTGPKVAQDALQHEAVKDLLYDPSVTYDAVIAEWYYSGLLAPLATLYECPLIWYTSGGLSWQTLKLMHEEPSPAYSVDQLSTSMPSLPFTTKERIYHIGMQAYTNLWTYYNTYFVEIPAYDAIYRTPLQLRKRYLSPYAEQTSNGSLLLVNSCPPLGQTLPTPQNVKLIGGHHIRQQIKPLPEALQTFLDNASKGVIFISLGENIKARMPKKQQEQLLDVLSHLELQVLWEVDVAVEFVPRNVRTLAKAPRLSILRHPNTKIFITDGSQGSLIEATYFEVPFIAVPTGDKFVNVDLAVARGLGRQVDFTQYLPWNLEGAVKQILGSDSYKENAQQSSAIFQRRLTSPNAELLHWIQEVITTRGAPHLRSPAALVPIFERYHADLWVLLVLALWFLSKVVKVVQVHLKDFDKKNQ